MQMAKPSGRLFIAGEFPGHYGRTCPKGEKHAFHYLTAGIFQEKRCLANGCDTCPDTDCFYAGFSRVYRNHPQCD